MPDVEFETLKADEMKFGKNNFLEIARKRAVSGEGSNEFIAISRGFYLQDGTKRFRRSVALPDDGAIVDFVVTKLKDCLKGTADKKEAKAEKAEAPAEAPVE